MADSFAVLVAPCSQAEAEAGTDNIRPMTALRTKQQSYELGANEGILSKKNLLYNFTTIPDTDIDGVPEFGATPNYDEVSLLTGLYFDQDRSTFVCGRLNHRGTFPTNLAQYSIVAGWATFCVDATDNERGENAKGSVAMGYQCLAGGGFASSIGFSNFVGNSGFLYGHRNWNGGIRRTIVSHDFTDYNTPGSVVVAGDRTTEFAAGTIVALRYRSDVDSINVAMNRVTSSSYSSPNTTINLDFPLVFEIVDASVLDSQDRLQKSYISTFGVGGQGFALGIENYIEGDASWAVGGANDTIGNRSGAIGRGVATRNKAEIGMSGGGVIDGTTVRLGQKSFWQLQGVTTSVTPKVLTLDGGAESQYVNTISLQNQSCLNATIRVACKSQYNGCYFKTWHNVVLEHQEDGTTTIVDAGTPVEFSKESHMASNAAVLSVAGDGLIRITVTGSIYKDIWSVIIEGALTGMTRPVNINA